MVRKILAVLCGLVTGIIVVLLIRTMSLARFPFPENLDWTNVEHRNDYISTLPDSAFWMTIFSQILGAFLAGLISALIAVNNRLNVGLISALLLLVFVLIANFTHQYPIWYLCISVVFTVVGGYEGAYVGNRRIV